MAVATTTNTKNTSSSSTTPCSPPCNVPPLLRLPCELLLQASSYLSLADLFSLRLTCHHVEVYLFDSFCKEFFAERRFMITFDSLKTLIDISKNRRLAGCLSYLTIGLDRFSSSDALPRFGDYWDPITHTANDVPMVKDGIDALKLDTFMLEQNCLISSGQFQLMLGEALSNLESLEELSLRDGNTTRRRATRLGSSPRIVSYGAAHVLRETGMDFTNNESHLHHQDHQFVDVVFSAVLLALGRGKTRLKSLAVDIQRGDIGLSSSAFSLPAFLLRDIQPTLSNLQSLDLSASFIQVAVGSYSGRSNAFLQWQRHQLFTFLEQTPNLVTLRVKSKEQGFFADGIIGWLASFLDAPSDKPSSDAPEVTGSCGYLEQRGDLNVLPLPNPEHRFRNLRKLELENMVAPAATLSTMLSCLSVSLKRLKLDKVALSVTGTDDEMENDPSSPNAWSSLFEDMYNFLDLEGFSVSALEHHTLSCKQSGRHPVAFLPSNFGVQSSSASGMLSAWSHVGSTVKVKTILREMSMKTIIICSGCKQKKRGYWSVEESIAA